MANMGVGPAAHLSDTTGMKNDSAGEAVDDNELLASFGLQLRLLGQLADRVANKKRLGVAFDDTSGESLSELPRLALRTLQESCRPLREILSQEESEVDTERFRQVTPQEPGLEVSQLASQMTESQRIFRLNLLWHMRENEIFSLLSKSSLILPETHLEETASIRRFFTRHVHIGSSVSSLMRPLDPNASVRVIWDCASAILLVMEAVVIPLQLVEAPMGGLVPFFVWWTNLWWTFDFISSFFVDFYTRGKLSGDFMQSAKNYVRTWFIFDFIILILGWISTREGALVRSVRLLRLARILRILRVGKLHVLMSRIQARIMSTRIMLVLRISKNLLALLVLTHLLACVWCALGKSTPQGWISAEGMDPSEFWRSYLVAFHWSITQFHGTMEVSPSTDAERFYAVVVVFVALLSFSLILSSVTQGMVQLGQHLQRQVLQMETLNTYLVEHNVSAGISSRVKQFFNAQRRFQQKVDSEVEYLKTMPATLAMDIMFEARAPYLSPHPLFAELCQDHARALRHVCHSACRQIPIFPDENIFSYGDACSRMFFVESGALFYVQGREPTGRDLVSSSSSHMAWMTSTESLHLQQLVAHDWLCEAALWTIKWRNTGNLAACTGVVIYTLDVAELAEAVGLYEKAFAICCKYAKRFIEQINSGLFLVTDLLTPNQHHEYEEPTDAQGSHGLINYLRRVTLFSRHTRFRSRGNEAVPGEVKERLSGASRDSSMSEKNEGATPITPAKPVATDNRGSLQSALEDEIIVSAVQMVETDAQNKGKIVQATSTNHSIETNDRRSSPRPSKAVMQPLSGLNIAEDQGNDGCYDFNV